ncbi:MAG: hypothetical protein IT198_06570 [Acidimicrobiia bacterium]|nr:hypothetical protein [Acidimicrobiia bacterium]
MLGRVLAVCLLAVAVLAAATTAAVTVSLAGPFPALHTEFTTSELPPGTPQSLALPPVTREWTLDYVDETHWKLELTATSDSKVAASDTLGRQVSSVGDYLEADGTELRSGNTRSGTASEGELDTEDALPPYVRGAMADREKLEKDRPSERFAGPEVAGRPTYAWRVEADISCLNVYAECGEQAPEAFEALRDQTAHQEETWFFDDDTGFPMVEELKIDNVVVYSYRVGTLSVAEA